MGIKKIGLTEALFTQVQQRVLGILFNQPDNNFYTQEIIRLANSGSGAIQRELKKLLSAGLITVKKIGNQHHYQANKSSPLFTELHSIVIKTFGLADVIKHALKPVKKEIKIAFIYGSIARQEDTASSDIDLLLISDNLTYAELYPSLEKAEKQLHRTINPTFYSPFEWLRKKKSGNHFIQQIIKQPKIFIVGTIDEFEEFK